MGCGLVTTLDTQETRMAMSRQCRSPLHDDRVASEAGKKQDEAPRHKTAAPRRPQLSVPLSTLDGELRMACSRQLSANNGGHHTHPLSPSEIRPTFLFFPGGEIPETPGKWSVAPSRSSWGSGSHPHPALWVILSSRARCTGATRPQLPPDGGPLQQVQGRPLVVGSIVSGQQICPVTP